MGGVASAFAAPILSKCEYETRDVYYEQKWCLATIRYSPDEPPHFKLHQFDDGMIRNDLWFRLFTEAHKTVKPDHTYPYLNNSGQFFVRFKEPCIRRDTISIIEFPCISPRIKQFCYFNGSILVSSCIYVYNVNKKKGQIYHYSR